MRIAGIVLALLVGGIAACAATPTTVRLSADPHRGPGLLATSVRILDSEAKTVGEYSLTNEIVTVTLEPGEYLVVAQGRSTREVTVPPELNWLNRPIAPERQPASIDDVPGTLVKLCQQPLVITSVALRVRLDVTLTDCLISIAPDR